MALGSVQELLIGEQQIPLNFNFSNHSAIRAGLTITSVVEITVDPAGEVTVESPTIDPTGTIVQALWTPGNVAKTYEVCCKVNTTGTAKPIVPGILRVKAC